MVYQSAKRNQGISNRCDRTPRIEDFGLDHRTSIPWLLGARVSVRVFGVGIC
jgi:hypothetical protein